jgi:hypothetical protein
MELRARKISYEERPRLAAFMCKALARTVSGYRLYWGVYVIPVSWRTRPYLIAIEPFRRILYPAMLGRIRRAWLAAYGTTTKGYRPPEVIAERRAAAPIYRDGSSGPPFPSRSSPSRRRLRRLLSACRDRPRRPAATP